LEVVVEVTFAETTFEDQAVASLKARALALQSVSIFAGPLMKVAGTSEEQA